MDDAKEMTTASPERPKDDLRDLVANVIHEYLENQKRTAEPAYKAELLEERKRREALERRVNELIRENENARRMAEEADRHAKIRSELQRAGVTKVDLAFRAIRDDVRRSEDGSLYALMNDQPVALSEYIRSFVSENPEFLPARIPGGSGSPPTTQERSRRTGTIAIDQIRPGMKREELEELRRQIAEAAAESFLKL